MLRLVLHRAETGLIVLFEVQTSKSVSRNRVVIVAGPRSAVAAAWAAWAAWETTNRAEETAKPPLPHRLPL